MLEMLSSAAQQQSPDRITRSGSVAAFAVAGMIGAASLVWAYIAAQRGYIDDVIEPRETLPRLISALEACATKREGRPPKKHGNIPL